jgi:hypothetical protein
MRARKRIRSPLLLAFIEEMSVRGRPSHSVSAHADMNIEIDEVSFTCDVLGLIHRQVAIVFLGMILIHRVHIYRQTENEQKLE